MAKKKYARRAPIGDARISGLTILVVTLGVLTVGVHKFSAPSTSESRVFTPGSVGPIVHHSRASSLVDPSSTEYDDSGSSPLSGQSADSLRDPAEAPLRSAGRSISGGAANDDFDDGEELLDDELGAVPVSIDIRRLESTSWYDSFVECAPKIVFRDGQVAGIELGQVPSDSLFAAMQLQSGDIIRAVNGQPVDNISRLPSLIFEGVDTTGASFTIEREGRLGKRGFSSFEGSPISKPRSQAELQMMVDIENRNIQFRNFAEFMASQEDALSPQNQNSLTRYRQILDSLSQGGALTTRERELLRDLVAIIDHSLNTRGSSSPS